MSEQVSLDDVGAAEDVLGRLIRERKALEDAEKVLRTYRAVKAQLQTTTEGLAVAQKELEDAKEHLSTVSEEFKVQMETVDREIEQYKNEQSAIVQREIEELRKEVDSERVEYGKWVTAASRTREEYAKDIEGYEKQLVDVKNELERVRKDHAVIANAISSVSQHFVER